MVNHLLLDKKAQRSQGFPISEWGGSRTRYLIPGRDGMGAGLGQRILPSPPPPPSPPQKGVITEYQILCFPTHIRDLDAILPPNDSWDRYGSFLFSKNQGISKNEPVRALKNRCKLQKMFLLCAGLGAPNLEICPKICLNTLQKISANSKKCSSYVPVWEHQT